MDAKDTGLERAEAIITALCSIEPRNTYYLAKRMELPLYTISAIVGQLLQREYIRKVYLQRHAYCTGFLTISELKEMLNKWHDIAQKYPEIKEYLERRETNNGKNNSIREEN